MIIGLSLSTVNLLPDSIVRWVDGHGDVHVDYVSGEWQWAIIEDDDPDMTIVELGSGSQVVIPDLEQFQFLGTPGSPLWVSPQVSRDGVPFIGIDISETPTGLFVNNRLEVRLAGRSGPGEFFLWSTDGSGNASILMDSSDGIDNSDAISVGIPAHTHVNWGFSAPGAYEIDLVGHGVLQADGTSITSDPQSVYFLVNTLEEGETDIEMLFDGDSWEVAIHHDPSGVEYIPEEVAMAVSPTAWTPVPDDDQYSFLGMPGSIIQILPEQETQGMLFPGIATDEIPAGVLSEDTVSLNLISVTGPGDFHLFSTDEFGTPEVYFSTGDGIDEMDTLSLGTGGHIHMNWAFSAPGTYYVTVAAEATLAESGQATSSDEVTLQFEVLPPAVLDSGEIDLEVAFEDGMLEIELYDDGEERYIELSHAILQLNPVGLEMLDDRPEFAFLGDPGDLAFLILQQQRDGLLYLGLGGDDVPAGTFENDTVELRLTGVEGPGDFFLFSIDAFGEPTLFLNTADGVDPSADMVPVTAGEHAHQNWAFTEPGVYRLTFQASGTPAGGGDAIVSEPVVVSFNVIRPTLYTQGEIDLEIMFDEDGWELAWIDELTEAETSPETSLIVLNPAARSLVPGNEDGAPASTFWILPQEERDGIPYIGLASDEIPQGVFENNRIDLVIHEVEAPGDVVLYQVDAFGQSEVFIDTRDGINAMEDRITLEAGDHTHLNWAFTEPGVYIVTVYAAGSLADDGTPAASDFTKLLFSVPFSTRLTSGEVDLEVVLEDGELEIEILDESTGAERHPSSVVLEVPARSLTPVPDGPAYGFLGEPGEWILTLPQEEMEGMLYLGIAGDEIPEGVLIDNTVTLQLLSVSGPGDFALYSTDEFGVPTVYFNTSDGVNPDEDIFPILTGEHFHNNWAFSDPGIYQIVLQAAASTLDGIDVSGEPVTVHFEVLSPKLFSSGEVDIELLLEDGVWEIALLDHDDEMEYSPGASVISADSNSRGTVPEAETFRFLGEPGQTVYILPQEEVEGLPYPGIATDEIPAGLLQGDSVSLRLAGVQGPGEFSLFQVDAFGEPTVYFNSRDGIDDADVMMIPTGTHAHHNWAFSEPGIYQVFLQVSGILSGDGSTVESQIIRFNFHISDEAENELVLGVRVLDGVPAIRWQSIDGEAYQVEYRMDISSGTWMPAGDPIAGTGEVIEYLLPAELIENPVLFLRVSR